MAMINYLGHVAITVKDMNRALDFYTKLGFSIIRKGENPTRKIAIIGNGLAQLELLALKKENANEDDEIGITHIAFHVDDMESAIEGLKKRGVEFTDEMTKHMTQTGKISVINFRDPDGTPLQLIQG